MLSFELADENNRVEIHGDKAGLLKLAKVLTELAESDTSESIHLMTKDWGGTGLSSEKQGVENELINHVKLFLWS